MLSPNQASILCYRYGIGIGIGRSLLKRLAVVPGF